VTDGGPTGRFVPRPVRSSIGTNQHYSLRSPFQCPSELRLSENVMLNDATRPFPVHSTVQCLLPTAVCIAISIETFGVPITISDSKKCRLLFFSLSFDKLGDSDVID
jgi:hypothetical protein